MSTKLSNTISLFNFFFVQFCKRPSQSIFSLASNSSSLVLLCKIWGVSKSLKSFMSAPRIGKDQQQFLENIGSSKLDNYILRSIPFAKSNINVEYALVWWLHSRIIASQNQNCHFPNLWMRAVSSSKYQCM